MTQHPNAGSETQTAEGWSTLCESTRNWIEAFVAASAAPDGAGLEDLFAESFTVGDRTGGRTIPRDVFVTLIPARRAAASAKGAGPARLTAVDEVRLDDAWSVVRTRWGAPLSTGGELVMRSTFLLACGENSSAVAHAYLNHEGLSDSDSAHGQQVSSCRRHV